MKCDRKFPCGFCTKKQLEHLCIVPHLPEPKRNFRKSGSSGFPSVYQNSSERATSGVSSSNETSSRASRDNPRKPLREPVPTAIGIISYLDSQHDTVFDRIISREPENPSRSCSCKDSRESSSRKCLIHSRASRHFLALFSESKGRNIPAAPDSFMSPSESWSYRKSLMVPEIRDGAKLNELKAVYDVLPPLSTIEKCLDYYFEQMNWCWGTVFPEILDGGFQAFKQLISEHSSYETIYTHIDPAFVSILLVIVATVLCVFQGSFEVEFPKAIKAVSLDDFVMSLHLASAKSLDIVEWLERPTMRTIQAAILLSDYCSLYYGHAKGAGESYIILSYRDCFKLNYHAEDVHLGSNVPYDHSLPPDNILLNREIRRRILLSVTIRYARDSVSGCFRSDSKIAEIPLPVNCRLRTLLQPEYANLTDRDIKQLDLSRIQSSLQEVTDTCWVNLGHHSLITTAQAVYEKNQNLGIMEFLKQLERSFATSFITERGLVDESVLNPITCQFSSERAIDMLMHYDPSQRKLPCNFAIDCFSALIVTKSILNMHEGFFALHLRTGNFPLSAFRVIEASRQILRLEYVLKSSPAVRMRTHISCLQRAVMMLFTAFLLKSESDDSADGDREFLHYRPPTRNHSLSGPGRYPTSDKDFKSAQHMLAGVLRNEDFAGDLALLRSLQREISFTSKLQGRIQSDRASISASLLKLLHYFISSIEVKLGSQWSIDHNTSGSPWPNSSAIDTTSQLTSDTILETSSHHRGSDSSDAPVISLPEILALTDDFTSCALEGSMMDNFFSTHDMDFEKIDTLGFLSLL